MKDQHIREKITEGGENENIISFEGTRRDAL